MTFNLSNQIPILKFDASPWSADLKKALSPYLINNEFMIFNFLGTSNSEPVIILLNHDFFHKSFVHLLYSDISKNLSIRNSPFPTTKWKIFSGRPSRFLREFQSIESIGEGGFGRVYSAINSFDLQKYAIKKVIIDSSKLNKITTKEILKEFQILAKLNHGNVVRYHTAWCEDIEENQENFIFESSDPDDSSQQSSVADSHLLENTNGIVNSCDSIIDFSNSKSSPYSNDVVFEYSPGAYMNGKHDDLFSAKSSHNEDQHNGTLELYSENYSKLHRKKYALYIQMELCQSNLKDWLAKRNTKPGKLCQLDLTHVRSLARQLLKGTEYIHSKNVIHRDIKPANIFLVFHENDIQLKIGDFGLAKSVEYHSNEDCNNDRMKYTANVGTTFYMAPEVSHIRKKSIRYNHKCDLYSVGIILLELMMKFSTYSELSRTVDKICNGHPITDLLQDWPIETIHIRNLISKCPETRPEINFILNETGSFCETIIKNGVYDEFKRLLLENISLKKENEILRQQLELLKL